MLPPEARATPGVPEIVAGQVLAGKYRVERVLGVGGMGMVVAALHLQLDERVAIKFMLPEAFASPEAVARFAREARAAVKIKSEHVAHVLDVGTLETGAPYMVMEYLEGSDLSAWLKQYGRLSVEQSVEFVLQAAEAIAEAHSLGIVHRDLKPANLFVVQRPGAGLSIKVLDFGISKVTRVGAPDFGVTKSSAAMGSPLYMSPELIADARYVDARCDIWALGVILYELIAGVTPFVADNLFNVMLLITQFAPPPLRTHAPHVPPALEAVIMKCLEKAPDQRYANVGQLAAALIDFAPTRARISLERIAGILGSQSISEHRVESSVPPQPVASTVASNPSSASWGRTSPPAHRRALFGIGLTALVITLISGATFVALRTRGAATAPASSNDSTAHGAATLNALVAAPNVAPVTSAAPASVASQALPVAASSEPLPLAVGAVASAVAKAPPLPASAKARDRAPPRGPQLMPLHTGSVYDDRK